MLRLEKLSDRTSTILMLSGRLQEEDLPLLPGGNARMRRDAKPGPDRCQARGSVHDSISDPAGV